MNLKIYEITYGETILESGDVASRIVTYDTVFSNQGAEGPVGPTGPIGPANTLSIGTVTTGSPGSSASATITGAAPSQVLSLTIPRGDTGLTGNTGDTGPANTLSIGTVTTGSAGSNASATITGTAPNQTLSLTIPRGDQGFPGTGVEILTSKGDLLYQDTSQANRLPIGSAGQVLKVVSGVPAWANESGAVTSVNGQTGAVTVSVPSASSSTPSALGTAAAGTSSNYARADHVHAMPTANDLGLGSDDTVTFGGVVIVDAEDGLSLTQSSIQHSSGFIIDAEASAQSATTFSGPIDFGGADPSVTKTTVRSNLGLGSAATANLNAISDADFRLIGSTDATKKVAIEVDTLVSAGTTRTLTAPNGDGIIQLTSAVSSQSISGNTLISSGRNRRIGLIAVSQTANVDLPYSDNQSGDILTLVGDSPFISSTLTIRSAGQMSGGVPIGYQTLATMTASGQSFTFVSDGTAIGWSLLRVDTHNHAASDITSGTLSNNRVNFAAPAAIGSTTPNTGAFTTLNANNGTLTASAPVLDLAQTWNNAAVAFTGIQFNITNTASVSAASGSKYFEIAVGGVPQIRFQRNFSTPYLYFGNTDTGVGAGSTTLNIICNGGVAAQIGSGSSGIFVRSDAPYQWSSTTGFAAADLQLFRDAADTLAQRRGTNPQSFRLYNTYTDASNYERGFLRWSSNVLQIGTEAAGTGSNRNIEFIRAASLALTILSGGSIQVEGLIKLGGTTSSFPALKRSSTSLQVRLADDSAFAPLSCGALTLNGNLDASTRDIVTDTTTGTKIGTGTTQKIGFWNAAPSAQPAAVADATDAASTQARLNDLLARLRTIGIIAT